MVGGSEEAEQQERSPDGEARSALRLRSGDNGVMSSTEAEPQKRETLYLSITHGGEFFEELFLFVG
jgi:hypothetical protein